jgi:glutathione S-transferase
MMKLYAFPQTRATRVVWALEEVGADYEYIKVDLLKGEGNQPAYRELNPSGKVPTFVDDDLVLTESAAICTYLGEKFPDAGLVPVAGSPQRAHYQQWCCFVIGELEQPLWTIAKHRFVLPEERRVPAVIDTAIWEFALAAKVLAIGLGDKAFILDERFTAADILIAHTLRWATSYGLSLNSTRLEAYTERLLGRPAMARVQQREQG